MSSSVYRTSDSTVSSYSAAAVTPSDSTVILVTRALYVGVGGNIAVGMGYDSSQVTFVNVPTGSILPIQVSQVLATGTTATNIIALY